MSTRSRPTSRLAGYLFVGAIVGATALGALSGSAIGESPILTTRATGPDGAAASGPVQYSPQAYRPPVDRPPDHYDLETPAGVVPVAELALHGRLRDRQLRWDESADTSYLDAQYPDMLSDDEIERLAHGPDLSKADEFAPSRPSPLPYAGISGEGKPTEKN